MERLKLNDLPGPYVGNRNVAFSDSRLVFVKDIKEEICLANLLAPDVCGGRVHVVDTLFPRTACFFELSEDKPQNRSAICRLNNLLTRVFGEGYNRQH